jgi:hypothetical protein
MRQLLDLASENTALKRELAQVRGEAAALKRYLVEVRQIWATQLCSPRAAEGPTTQCVRTQVDAMLVEVLDPESPGEGR